MQRKLCVFQCYQIRLELFKIFNIIFLSIVKFGASSLAERCNCLRRVKATFCPSLTCRGMWGIVRFESKHAPSRVYISYLYLYLNLQSLSISTFYIKCTSFAQWVEKHWDIYKRNETIKIFINSGQLDHRNCLPFIRVFAHDNMHPRPGEGWEGESPVRRGAVLPLQSLQSSTGHVTTATAGI